LKFTNKKKEIEIFQIVELLIGYEEKISKVQKVELGRTKDRDESIQVEGRV